MGCGYSKTNSKKRRRLKDNLDVCNDSSDPDQSPEFGSEKYRRLESSSETLKNNGLVNSTEDSLASRRRIANKIKPISGPMRAPINRSASQLSFFRMLDEKIANGKDLDEETADDREELISDIGCSIVPSAATDDDVFDIDDDVALGKLQSTTMVTQWPPVSAQRPLWSNGTAKSVTKTECHNNVAVDISASHKTENVSCRMEQLSNGQVVS